jgi:hypothetical protein
MGDDCIDTVILRIDMEYVVTVLPGPTESRLSTTCLMRSPSPRTMGGMRGSLTLNTSTQGLTPVHLTAQRRHFLRETLGVVPWCV